jgi:hypothetical protein
MKSHCLLILVFLSTCLCSNGQSQKEQGKTLDSLYSGRGEVYFHFTLKDPGDIHKLTRIISIDNIKGSEVFAYANRNEFSQFLGMGYPYRVLQHPGTLIPASELNRNEANQDSPETIWNFYPNYQQYLDYMAGFVTAYPGICRLDTVGTSIQGRLILALRISDNVNQVEAEPHFLYTSSIHGDELTGYVLMLHLIDYLLSGYGIDPRVTEMVNNTEIVINPLANPDGTFHGGNGSVYGAVRYNANNIDLNRNFPDPKVGPHPDGNAWQQETEEWMAYADINHFSLSMNFHGGAEVFNYPWDTWAKLAADDAWWQFVAREYVDTVHLHAPAGYLTDMVNGITNGWAWYEINGGRQDYMNYWHYCREATLEISEIKLLPATQLLNFWGYNYRSFLNYIEQVQYGFSGIVTDTVTGQPVEAKVFIFGHDTDNSHVYSSLPTGFYTRPIAEGTYNATFSAPGYFTKSVKNISVAKWSKTLTDVQLRPLTFGVEEPVEKTILVYPNPNSGSFSVRLPDEIKGQKAEVEIINSQGRTIYSREIDGEQGMIKGQVEIHQPGLYFLKITAGRKVYGDKIMVIR